MLITSLLIRWRFDAIKVSDFFTLCLFIGNSSSPLPYQPTNYYEQHDHNTRQHDYTSKEDALCIWWKKTNDFQTNYQLSTILHIALFWLSYNRTGQLWYMEWSTCIAHYYNFLIEERKCTFTPRNVGVWDHHTLLLLIHKWLYQTTVIRSP